MNNLFYKIMERKNGKWTIKNSEKVFENDFFEVIEDRVIQPDGKDGKYATIKFKSGASVLPLDDEGFIYLTKQFRYAIERFDLECASGSISGEKPLEAAKRETLEELGIKAEKWTQFGKLEANTSITKSNAFLFLAEELSFYEPQREKTEEIETVKMKLDEAVEKVLSGEITHDQTCILIL